MEDFEESESISSSFSDDDDSESMKSAKSTDFESVLKKFDSMKAIDLKKNRSTLRNDMVNPELYMQLYPLDDDMFKMPEGYLCSSA